LIPEKTEGDISKGGVERHENLYVTREREGRKKSPSCPCLVQFSQWGLEENLTTDVRYRAVLANLQPGNPANRRM
jgi:hypothetical protein